MVERSRPAEAKNGKVDSMTGKAVNSVYSSNFKDPRYCSICGKNMVDPVTGAAFIGMSFELSAHRDSALAFFKKQLGVYGDRLGKDSPLLIDIC